MSSETRTALTTVGTQSTTLNGQTISFTIKSSTRARHVRLEMKQRTGLVVVLPEYYDTSQLPLVLESNKRWILNSIGRFTRNQPVDGHIPYLGQELKLVTTRSSEKASTIKLERKRLLVSLANGSNLAIVLEQWYRYQAERLIEERVERFSSQLGLRYERLTIRGQRTRWGSCSRKGNLSINWKLIMLPEPVIDYVIIHELSHLKEMNHSKRFWQLVAESCPRWRKHRKWLREHERYLADLCLPDSA